MMSSKLCKEDPNLNMILISGMAIEEDTGKLTKENVEVDKETCLEARKSFAEVSTLGSKDQPVPETDPLMIATLLETCTKFL